MEPPPAQHSGPDGEDQYLFGPDLLVAPITEYQARRRPVYLPAGADWTDAGSGRTLAAGVTVTGAAPLEHIPVFVRGHKEERPQGGAVAPVPGPVPTLTRRVASLAYLLER